ncbi:unnamed protein product, partial [Phaeothamnion confervicola]
SGLATTQCGELVVENVSSYGHERAGFRLGASGSVQVSNCYAANCGDGGFVPVSGSTGISLSRCTAVGCGQVDSQDGFRLVGIRHVVLDDCAAYRNEGAGVMVLNGCSDVLIKGGIFADNGRSTTPVTRRDSRSGIGIKSFGKPNERISILGV